MPFLKWMLDYQYIVETRSIFMYNLSCFVPDTQFEEGTMLGISNFTELLSTWLLLYSH